MKQNFTYEECDRVVPFAKPGKKQSPKTGLKKSKVSRNTCESGKTCHRDHKEAVRALHKAQNARKRDAENYGLDGKRPERVYRCGSCGYFHLTHIKVWGRTLSPVAA